MSLKSLYKKMKKKRMMNNIQPYVDLNSNSFYGEEFSVKLFQPNSSNIYLEVGEHSVIHGKYVFEKESGHIKIGNRVHIGNSMLISINEIIIEDDVTIAWDCLIYDHNSHSTYWEERKNDTEQEYNDIKSGGSSIANKNWNVVKSAPIHICSKAWIGAGVKILKGVTIGEGAIVAAGSVVVKNVEPWTIVGGNPARKIRCLQESL